MEARFLKILFFLQICKLVLQDLALSCWRSIGVVQLAESYKMPEFEPSYVLGPKDGQELCLLLLRKNIHAIGTK